MSDLPREATRPATAGQDAVFMARALELVSRATHRVSPNPLVGCVVVKDGQVVGEGVTQPPGQAHAEIQALQMAGERARGAEMYVTLEPCCHHGRTPPCTDAILAAGVVRVVAGVEDPNPVAGGGLKHLAAAGLEVALGPGGEACARQIAPFKRHILDRRPWVLLKAAVTLDGRIAAASGDARWITGDEARADAHRLRAKADAVLVGVRTVLADDPRLNVRHVEGKDPLRVVLDSQLKTPVSAALAGPGTVIFHGPGVSQTKRQALLDLGVELVEASRLTEGLSLPAVLASLGQRGIIHLLVEGGGRVHGGFVAARLADEACWYIAPRLLGRGLPALDLPSFPTVAEGLSLEAPEVTILGRDVRIRGAIRYPAPTSD